MTHSRLYKVTDTKLIIELPVGFRNKEVMVTIDDHPAKEDGKLALMKLAATDPLFLLDLKEVNDDFEGIEHDLL